uniref:WAP domain-containing protein n=1 Tax=Panagrolaimus davidi TaxID=227884 RepID=A0A914PEW8_9BILA
MIDSGVTCTKRSYGRGAGKPLKCKPDQVEDAALCYKSCANNFRGVGPVCWHHCPSGLKSCGALCLPTVGDCVATIFSIAEEIALTVAEIAFEPEDAPIALTKAIAGIGAEFKKYKICPNIS